MGPRRSGVGITGLSSSATTLACSASISRLVICAHSLLAQFAAQRLAQLGDRLQRLVVERAHRPTGGVAARPAASFTPSKLSFQPWLSSPRSVARRHSMKPSRSP
jgi:hypothetical protein